MESKLLSKDPLKVLATTKPYFDNPKFVFINKDKLNALSQGVKERIAQGLPDSDIEFKGLGSFDKDAQLVFLENVVNFCFWAEKGQEKWKVEFEGRVEDGAAGLGLVFARALAEDQKILDADYLCGLTLEEVKYFFRPSNGVEIPLIEARHKNLVEAGRILAEKYDGLFSNLIRECRFEAVEITKRTIEDFDSFNDSYAGINFYKRAQLNTFDVAQILGSEKPIEGLEALTAMADYKLPQVLREFGAIEYSEALVGLVDGQILIDQGSREEIEIRCATIWVTEMISTQLGISPGLADRAIWWLSCEIKAKNPYHRTYSIYY